MKGSKTIGAGQFFLLIFLSRVVLTLTYSINSGGHTVSNADWLAALFMPLVLVVMGIPAFCFLRFSGGRDLCDFAFTLGKGTGKLLSFLYGSLFLLLTFTPVARFSFFVTSTVQTEKGEWFFPLLIMGAVVFGASKGIQAVARTGAVLAVIGTVAIGTILLALIPRIDWLNVYNPVFEGWQEVGKSVLLLIGNSLEISMIYMLAPHIKGSVTKAYLGYCITA
ncbi:MAG: GerAB/ArcD/ProY family transporter, partial [Clostridia bacterium]|nr:GerAB/ArcD/ProY family transporter [Clostridia bacterium]